MQFRFRDKDIEVCRLTIDPQTGERARMRLGTMDLATLKVSSDLRDNCRPEDLLEIARWRKRYKRTRSLQAEQMARTLPEQIQRALEWLSNRDDDAQVRALAEDIRANWQTLRRTLIQKELI